MSNNTWLDSNNDSLCNRVASSLQELRTRLLTTDFSCPMQVEQYNMAIRQVKSWAGQLHELEYCGSKCE